MARHLMRFTAVASVLLIAACGEDREPTSPHVPIVQRFGTISVFLDLEGDSSFALKQYGIAIDATKLLRITPNSNVETSASEGTHIVSLKLPDDELWCAGSGPYTQSVTVIENQRSFLDFHVRCPTVEGNGKFIIMLEDFAAVNCWVLGCDLVARRGVERSTVILQNITEGTVVENADIPFWQRTEIAVPAGVYQIKVEPSSNCGPRTPTFTDLVLGIQVPGLTRAAAVHDAETSSQEFYLVCH